MYTITSDDDWTAAVADIERNLRESRDRFPESVVDQSSFLVEEYITGEEFAVDVYFDGEGEPVILNIFTHRFASLSDVSDRLYYTGKDVIEANKARFEAFFRKVNALMGIRDFPAHVELRSRAIGFCPSSSMRCVSRACVRPIWPTSPLGSIRWTAT